MRTPVPSAAPGDGAVAELDGSATHEERRTPSGPTPLAARLANNAALLRLLGRPLLRFLPVLSIGRLVVVSRHADVLDVLERDQDFTIAEVNADAMDRINGPFVLGMDRSELYTRERSVLARCVQADDQARVRREVSATGADLLAAAVPRGRIDVVQELARPAATRLAASYLGVPGPDEDTMMRWMRLLFWEAFLNTGGNREVRRAGERAAAEFHAHLDGLVADRRAEAADTGHDDLLRRLVRPRADGTRLSDEAVRRNIAGVVVGAVETTTKATAHAVDQLLRRPEALAGASLAARGGDVAVVAQHVFEALRFNPLTPVLVRHAARDTVVAAGTPHQRHVRAGRTVYAAALPAMFDPRTFDDPHSFRHDRRPAADLLFGYGMHACFGRYVNLVSIPELVMALLRCGRVRRAPGAEGRMRYEGPFPDRLLVDLDPAGAPDGGWT
jgi:cytochrome P450